ARTTEDEAVTVAVLANDTGAGLRVVAVSRDGASIGGDGTSVRFDPGDRYQGLAADAEEQVVLEYTVQDSAGTEARATLTVTVGGLNDRPTALALDDAIVAENAAGAVIGTLSVTDPDAGDTFTYSVDDDRLEVVEGRLKLK